MVGGLRAASRSVVGLHAACGSVAPFARRPAGLGFLPRASGRWAKPTDLRLPRPPPDGCSKHNRHKGGCRLSGMASGRSRQTAPCPLPGRSGPGRLRQPARGRLTAARFSAYGGGGPPLRGPSWPANPMWSLDVSPAVAQNHGGSPVVVPWEWKTLEPLSLHPARPGPCIRPCGMHRVRLACVAA